MRCFRPVIYLSLATLVFSGCASTKPSLPTWLGGGKAGSNAVGANEKAGDSITGVLALARLSERRGQAEHAEQVYRQAIEKWPDNPLPHHRLAVMEANAGRFEKASQHFARAMELDPSNAELLSDYGYFCYLQDNAAAAEDYLRRAVELDPNNTACCNNLAVVLGEQGRYREAAAVFGRVGTDAEVLANMAFVYARRGEIEKATKAYSRALDQNPELRPAAEALAQLAKYDSAPESLSRQDASTEIASLELGPVRRRERPTADPSPSGTRPVRAEETVAPLAAADSPRESVTQVAWNPKGAPDAVETVAEEEAGRGAAGLPLVISMAVPAGEPQQNGIAVAEKSSQPSSAAAPLPPPVPFAQQAGMAVPNGWGPSGQPSEIYTANQSIPSAGSFSMPTSYHSYRD